MQELSTFVTQINELHTSASSKARQAINDAKAAGELLLQVKATLPHGTFKKWIADHLNVSVRQAQRYMYVAQGKPHALRNLAGKSDTVSLLENEENPPFLKFNNGVWIPEPKKMYLFNENGAFWVTPAANGGTHVCRHYSGERITSENFYWRYTILGEITDPDFTFDHYIGTRFAPINRTGIAAILRSYGLTDLQSSLVKVIEFDDFYERPVGEPDPENWYWDSIEPDDGLFQALKKSGHVNSKGSATFIG